MKTKPRTGPAIAYRVGNPADITGQGYRHLTIQVMIGRIADAAAAYDESPNEYNLERLEQIRVLGESARYFDSYGFHRKVIEVRWQADRDSWDSPQRTDKWYGCQVESASFDADVAKVLGKLTKVCESGWNTSPAEFVDALHSLRAVRVRHEREAPMDAWIIEPEPVSKAFFRQDPWGRESAAESVGAA